jgi:hypothetical protein
MLEHIARNPHRDTERWYWRGDVRLEHRSDDFDDQHEYGRHLFSDSNGYEGLHRIRHRYTDG